jgi:hypothetical protein
MVELIILAVLCFLCWRGGRRKQEQEDQVIFQKYEEEIRDNRQYIRELHAELRQKSAAPTEAAPTDAEPQEPEQPIPVPPTPAPEPIVPKPVTTIRKSILQYGCLFACCTVILVAFAVYMSHDKDEPAERAPAPETSVYTQKETFSLSQETKPKETAKETTKPKETKSPEEIEQEYKDSCTTPDYNAIERNPDDYKGKEITFSGTVIQVSEGWFNSVTLRIETEDGIWYAKYTREDGEARILEDDTITVYGECKGVESYSAVFGNKITIPRIDIKYYEIP